MIEKDNKEIPVVEQAALLGINRTSLYYSPHPEPLYKQRDRDLVETWYEKHPFFGYRKLSEIIKQQDGITINKKRVLKYMRQLGISAICPGPNLSRRNQKDAVRPYLLRGLKAEHSNHIWGIDITYIKFRGGCMYLVAVVDWYSRYVVAWELADSLEISFVIRTVKHALTIGTPKYWNSDQGSHFTSKQYILLLEEKEIQISMDGKGGRIFIL